MVLDITVGKAFYTVTAVLTNAQSLALFWALVMAIS